MTHRTNESHRNLSTSIGRAFRLLFLLALVAVPVMLKAQSGGQGAITGTVSDSTGAAIPDATVSATNLATNVVTTRTSSGAGSYSISPLPPGVYSVEVTAKGFKTLRQDNLSVDALNALGFNPVLSIGDTTETVEVTAAPPVLDTTNATVGLVMENSTYANLPLQMNNGARDATAFASLAPGAQAGTRVPIIGGTSNYLGQLYLDGLPAQTINQQGDNRLVSQAVDLDAVDQFQVVTSTPPAEYSGAGALNFTMKSGGNKYHGQVSDFVRNTAFDAWSFTAKAVTVTNLQGVKVPAPKPSEHQNELSVTFGGHVPHTANKLFFFFAYDKFHSRRGGVPQLFTVPTTLMAQGDFTELNGNYGTGYTGVAGDPSAGGTNKPVIYDPTSNVCVGTTCTRTAFQGLKNGVPTNNVIPVSYQSPIALKMESFLPAPTFTNTLTNNYLGSNPTGFDNHVLDWRVDFDLNAKHRISSVGGMGAVHYLNNFQAGGSGSNTYGYFPLPYVGGTYANIFPKVYQVEDTWTINDHLINQLKYGFTRFIQPQSSATDGVATFAPSAMGITNLPAGQASTVFPGVGFGTTGALATTITGWAGPNNGGFVTQTVSPSTYAVLDNLQWLKGKHSITAGFSFMWEEINSAAPKGYSSIAQLQFNSNSTAQYTANASTLSSSSGNSYASFLLGAVGNNGGAAPSMNLQPVSEVGGRYHVAAPYIQDNWKVSNKLTVDMGIRWDYFPPFHEVKDRWTFLNPSLTNAATGTPGEMQFAGNYGGTGVSCNCRTPVQSYWKNFGPRVGLAYALDENTVFRAGIARVFSQAGGVGGRGGNAGGSGQLGFNVTASATPESTSGVSAGPSFYLNNGAALTGKGLANTDFLGKGFAYPANPTPNSAAQLLNTGNYLDANGKLVTAGSVTLADFYISGRAPEFTFFNAGIERSITKDMTIAVNYAGDQAHFLNTGGNRRGYYANQLNPIYIAALGPLTDSNGTKPLLIAAATSANVAKAQAAMAGLNIPAFYQAAANAFPTSSTLTIAQGLVAFPQYSGVTDLWGANSANFSYHSLQVTLLQRKAHGASFNVNYTYSKNIGDDGTFRSGFAIPSAALSGGGQSWKQDRIDRSWTTISAPQVVHAYGVYELPFGKGHIGDSNALVRMLVGGWQVAGIYTYGSGSPVAVVSNHCTGTTFPLQGQCMPDVAVGATNARINGSYGTSPTGVTNANLGNIKYFDSTKFATPTNVSTVAGSPIYLIGNAPRTQALNLRNPGNQNLDTSLHRTFNLPKDIGTFVFEVDCLNTWNKVTFSGPAATVGASNFGQITGVANTPRDFQFAGHINF
jgi:Carboxypeptidase regulatory-like domain